LLNFVILGLVPRTIATAGAVIGPRDKPGDDGGGPPQRHWRWRYPGV